MAENKKLIPLDYAPAPAVALHPWVKPLRIANVVLVVVLLVLALPPEVNGEVLLLGLAIPQAWATVIVLMVLSPCNFGFSVFLIIRDHQYRWWWVAALLVNLAIWVPALG